MIRNLIFDVGDVLVEYRWFEMLTRDYGLSEAEAKRIGEEMFDNEIWVQGLDGGRLSLEEAIHQYELKYPDDVEKGYKIYLLSNYSEELLHVHTKGAKFLNVLDGGVVSYQVHALKPDREIYEILLEKYSLKAEECLFFDDRMDNVEGAKKAGIQAIQVTSREMLNETLDKMLTK